ncbi:MAG: tetratricopeptide repeat protein [Candidatus Riflebacteria bacterium]|nr:tetratricopeptide repeat protein [Candidatus Riflebacteria bacterium]
MPATYRVLMVLVFALVGTATHLVFFSMEAAARRVDRLDNVHARGHVQVYFDLAQVYIREGRTADAITQLEKGLQLYPWHFENQLALAGLEIGAGKVREAAERLRFLIELDPDPGIVERARRLLVPLGQTAAAVRSGTRPSCRRALLGVVGFDGTDPRLVRTIAAAVAGEFGIRTRVLDLRPVPSAGRARRLSNGRVETPGRAGSVPPDELKSLGAGRLVQLDADVLIGQLHSLGRSVPGAGELTGLFGVVTDDLYANDLNFLFGTASESSRTAVMSYARFAGPGQPEELVVQRAVKQAFSSVGFLLGIRRCTTPNCARAYPHSLAEHDRKGGRLCSQCLGNLTAAYRLRGCD